MQTLFIVQVSSGTGSLFKLTWDFLSYIHLTDKVLCSLLPGVSTLLVLPFFLSSVANEIENK